MTTLLVLVVIVALLFDFANGWNDSANAIATIVSTRVLSPLAAVVMAAILNFAGAFASTRVAQTIGTGLVDPSVVTGQVVLASMLAAALWVAVCTFVGLPISGSHALIGALVGAAAAAFGLPAVKGGGLVTVLAAMLLSPALGFIVGGAMLVAVYWIAYFMTPQTVRKVFGRLQLLSSAFVAFTHGTNDAQKVMGVITLALFSARLIPAVEVPTWVMVACALAMACGTAVGGWKVIRTLGMRLAHIRPIEGFAAETATGAVLSLAAALGVPVSSTHTLTGAIVGTSAVRKLRAVRWGIGIKIVFAWVLTLPACALLGALFACVCCLLPTGRP